MHLTVPRGWLLAGLILAAAAAFVAGVTVRSIATERRAQFEHVRVTTEQTMADAVSVEAERWAPGLMTEAQEAVYAARVFERTEDASWWPLPDFTKARSSLELAAEKAGQAAELAVESRDRARDEAIRALTEVRGTLAHHAALARTLSPEARRAASRARLAFDQALHFFDEGDFGAAVERATAAQALSRGVTAHVADIGSRYADVDQVASWRRLVDDTVAWSRRTGQPAIVVAKAEHRLTLYVAGRVIQHYDVDLSSNWVSDKLHQGDDAVPEGRYRVVTKKGRGQSRYHKALMLDYPNESNRRAFTAARRAGRIAPSSRIGGLIEIHGEGGQGRDWTDGCVALTNAEMDQLFAQAAVGTPVTIVGALSPHLIADLAAVSAPERR